MSSTPWVTITAGAVTATLTALVALYVNVPWRKRLLDEIAIHRDLPDGITRRQLAALIEKDARKYVRRRTEHYLRSRALSAVMVGASIVFAILCAIYPFSNVLLYIGAAAIWANVIALFVERSKER